MSTFGLYAICGTALAVDQLWTAAALGRHSSIKNVICCEPHTDDLRATVTDSSFAKILITHFEPLRSGDFD
jgi:hypothetical protein